jgi:hypothetical protein
MGFSVYFITTGITGKLAVFAKKKYKSHRRVPDDVLNQIT